MQSKKTKIIITKEEEDNIYKLFIKDYPNLKELAKQVNHNIKTISKILTKKLKKINYEENINYSNSPDSRIEL